MKKITLLSALFLLLSFSSYAQFGCANAVPITDGFTQSGITTPGNGGPENWVTSATSSINAGYFADDVYLFTYTAGAADEEISITTVSVNAWNGIGFFTSCVDGVLSGALAAQGSNGGNATKTITAMLPAGQTVYIASGQWGTPNDLNFSVTNFSATPLVNPPNCTVLLTPANGAQNISSGTLTWTAASGSPTGYQLTVGTTAGGNNILNGLDVGAVTSYTLASIASGTTYYVTVTPYNNNGEATGCDESSFTTCGVETAPLTEEFGTFPPSCWSRAAAGDVNSGPIETAAGIWAADGFLNNGATGAIKVNLYLNNRIGWLISPTIDLSAGNMMVSFDYGVTTWGETTPSAMGSDDTVQLLLSEDNGATWQSVVLIDANSGASNTSQTATYVIPSTSATAKFAFLATDGTVNDLPDYDFFVDNFVIEPVPACSKPTMLTVDNTATSSNSGTVSWVESVSLPTGGYEYYYSTSADDVPNEATTASGSVAAGVLFAEISGLDPETTYYVWVRSACSANSKSAWTSYVSFKTMCEAISSLPWEENFDSLATGTNVFPTCWAYTNTTSNWSISTSPVAHSGANSLRRTWSTNGWAFTPTMTLTGGSSYTISYYVKTNTATVGYDITVKAGTTQSPEGMTEDISAVTGYAGVNWTKVSYEFTPVTTDDYTFGLHVVAPSAPSGINFDDFHVDLTPTCVEPTALMVDPGVSYDSASISWTESVTTPANGYEYYLSTDNTAPTSSTDATASVAAGQVSADLASLDPQTTYFVWVRSVCSPTDKSEWSSSASFTTLCSPITPAYTEEFGTFPPSCWTRSGAGNELTGPTGTGTGIWAADGFLNNGTTGAVKVNLYNLNRIGWLISPLVDLSAGNYAVSFDYGATTWNATTPTVMGSDDRVVLMMSEDAGATWTEVVALTANSNVSNSIQTSISVITSTSPNAMFAFFATDGTVDDTPDYDFFIDNFVIDLVPTCVKPTGISVASASITPSSANISWNGSSSAPANGYEYYYSTSQDVPANDVTVSGSVGAGTLEAAITGLDAQTAYYVFVRSVCSGTDRSDWSGPISFTTACGVETVGYTQDFATFVPNCWSRSGAGNVTTGPTGTGTGIWAADGFLNAGTTGAVKVNLYSNNRIGWLISPTIDLSNGNAQVSFDYGASIWDETGATPMGSDDVVELLMSEDNGQTWITLVSLNANSGVANEVQQSITSLSTTSSTVKFALYATDGAANDDPDYDFFIDNFKVEPNLSVPGTKNDKFAYYPNPVKDILNLSFTKDISDVNVFNILGQQVITKKVNAAEGKVDMSNLAAGTYIVKVTADSQTKTFKVVKQ